LISVVLLAAVGPTAHAASRQVPQGFVGMNADGPLLSANEGLKSSFGGMVKAGVESIRSAFYWARVQPYASFAEVPTGQRSQFTDVGGIPTDFSSTDRLVDAAARRRLSVLPVVLYAPQWDALHPNNFSSPPSDPAPYGRFMATLAARYGPNGSFWQDNPSVPKVPIRDWQIWNEPDSTKYWSDQPFVDGYAALLKAAHSALKAVDPAAQVVLAGFPSRSWVSLARLYAAGAGPYFDVVGIHPFTMPVANVLRILTTDRKVMAQHNDSSKPIYITETSWPSAKGKTSFHYGFEVTEAGQAKKARQLLNTLASVYSRYHVERLYWYTWLSLDSSTESPFDYAGLLKIGSGGKVIKKPALQAFKRAALRIEGCRAKRVVATSCVH
jgi:Glycosyl hydrolase family 53